MTKQYLMPASRISTSYALPMSAGTAGDLYVKTPVDYPSGYLQIGTPAELVAFAARVNAGETTLNACLTADIDMTDVSYAYIGTNSRKYAGTFDGCGHTVSNLTLSSDFGGLFGVTNGATIRRISCSGFTITATGAFGAGLVAYLSGSSTIADASVVDSTITTSGKRAGGIAGYVYNSSVQRCYTYNNQLTGSYCGGIGAIFSSGSASNCATYGGSHGNTIGNNATITNCYTSSSTGVTQAVFQSQGFWDGTGVSGTMYLSWDFAGMWGWDATNSLPMLKPLAVGTETLLYANNGSAWVLQNTILDDTPTSASTNGVTSGSVYAALAGKVAVSQGVSRSGRLLGVGSDGEVTTIGGRILHGIYEPSTSLGNDGDLYLLCTEDD